LSTPYQNSMASPEEYQWLSNQMVICGQVSVWKHCELPQETQAFKSRSQTEQLKPSEYQSLEKSIYNGWK
jgi:hypothetical protein